jgi:hypothetical protein
MTAPSAALLRVRAVRTPRGRSYRTTYYVPRPTAYGLATAMIDRAGSVTALAQDMANRHGGTARGHQRSLYRILEGWPVTVETYDRLWVLA